MTGRPKEKQTTEGKMGDRIFILFLEGIRTEYFVS
jgi:hypothetical protein